MAIKAVGLLSPGDMGNVVAQVLLRNGMNVLTCLSGRSERTCRLSRQAGIGEVDTLADLVRETDLILTILVPAAALDTAKTVAQVLRETGETTVYVDANAVAPRTTHQIGQVITAAGSQFVDAGIIGPPPREEGVTRFYASGPQVETFAELNRYGLDIRPLGHEIGQGSGIKMCYAAMTKGLAALQTELLVAAKSMGVYDALVEEWGMSQPGPYEAMQRRLPVMPTKSRRWIGEMEEIAQTFEDVGLTPRTYQGVADMYRFVGETSLADETPENRDRSRTLEQMVTLLADHLNAGKST